MTTFTKSIAAAASAGLLLGAVTACGGSATPADSPEAPAAEGKACCKGMNECKGQGGCAAEGKHECKGKNECKGQGGCNSHCPK